MTGWYRTDPGDPDAPVALDRWGDYEAGDRVRHHNPSLPAADLPGTHTVEAIYQFRDVPSFGLVTTTVLDGGALEVNADHLAKAAR